MTVVADRAKAIVMKDQLEHRGYRVTEIVTATFTKAGQAS